jgi:hypothetical protein
MENSEEVLKLATRLSIAVTNVFITMRWETIKDDLKGLFSNGPLSQNIENLFFWLFVEIDPKSLERYTSAQYLIDLALKSISIRLHKIFKTDQEFLKKTFKAALGPDAKSGSCPREYLVHSLQNERNKMNSEIESLKKTFNEIISLAKEIGFQVFDEEEYRYNWYYSLSLSRSEVYGYFHREGIPESFIKA